MPAVYGLWVLRYRQILIYLAWIVIIFSLSILPAEISICFLMPLINLPLTDPLQIFACMAPILALITGALTIFIIKRAFDGPRPFYRNSIITTVLSFLSAILLAISFGLFIAPVLGYWASNDDATVTSISSTETSLDSPFNTTMDFTPVQSTTEIFETADTTAVFFTTREITYGEDTLRHDRNMIYNMKTVALLAEFILTIALLITGVLHFVNALYAKPGLRRKKPHERVSMQDNSTAHRLLVDSGPHTVL